MTAPAEHDALREAVGGLLAKESPERAWPRLCAEIGVAGLAVPECYGGAGAGLPEVCVVLEELGRTLTPAPMLGSAVLAASVVLAGADEPSRARLLPGIAAGSTTAALAWAGPDGRWDPALPACRWDGRLYGTAHYVLDGASATVLLVAARAESGVRLFEIDPADADRVAATPLDDTRELATITLDGCEGRPLHAEGDRTGALEEARDIACVALAAEQVGAAGHCLDATVAYTKQRVQYGHPIAQFQALQHRLADLYVLVETARSIVRAAADAPDRRATLAAAAAEHCSRTFELAAAEMIQMHGGIAITWEHEAHRYFKRAHGDAQLFGQPHEHRSRLAADL